MVVVMGIEYSRRVHRGLEGPILGAEAESGDGPLPLTHSPHFPAMPRCSCRCIVIEEREEKEL